MSPRSSPSPVPIRFDREEWLEEVGRLDERSLGRNQAERARREIEAGTASLNWQRCEAQGESGTSLPGCNKLYVPLGKQGASEAPFGLCFSWRRTRTAASFGTSSRSASATPTTRRLAPSMNALTSACTVAIHEGLACGLLPQKEWLYPPDTGMARPAIDASSAPSSVRFQ